MDPDTPTGAQPRPRACPTEAAGPWPAPLPDLRAATSEPLDIVDEWGRHSFPASDPPANW